jgi:uncharacterized OsmC-like protein
MEPMPEFMVELYVSQADCIAIAVWAERVNCAAAELTAEGRHVRLLRSILDPEDETCFLLVEAEAAEAVRETARRAALPVERVVEAAADLVNPNGREQGMSSTVTDTIRNGVDTEVMFGTLDAIKAQPALGRFQFRARNRWLGGSYNRTTIHDFYGAGQEDTSRAEAFTVDAGEPPILLGANEAANPAEYLLHALAACLTTSLVYVAAARAVRLTEVESTLEGDMDVRGALGLDDEYRNGFEQIRVSFRIKGDAPEEKLREVVARAQQRSAVFDMVTNGVPVSVEAAVA